MNAIDPLVEEARHAQMIPFIRACRAAGYTRMVIDEQDMIHATWDSNPVPAPLAAYPREAALWGLVREYYGLGNASVTYRCHSAQAAGATRRLVNGTYDLTP